MPRVVSATSGVEFSGVDLSGGIDPTREFVMAKKPTIPGTRDAVNVWIEEENGRFAMRIGVEALAEEWDNQLVWVDIAFADGRVFSLRDTTGKTHSAIDANGKATIRSSGNVKFQLLEPFKRWQASFDGEIPETTAANLIKGIKPENTNKPVQFDIEMNMAAPPWVPGSLLEQGNKVMEGEQGEFISPRYEQLFRCIGNLKIDGATYHFKGNGLRIRRQGIRKFEGFWGHCWQSAVFPSGKAFGFNTFPPRDDGKPNYNEGYIFDGSGVLKPAKAVVIPWLTELNTSGDDVSFELETAAGRVKVKGVTFINTRSLHDGHVPEGFPIVQQAHAHYEWDGEKTVGMVERSSKPSIITNL